MSSLSQLLRGFLRSPILWGGLAALGFYSLIVGEVLAGPFYQRYFTSHWCLYVETILFWIGVAALVLKAFDIAAQSTLLKQRILPEPSHGGGLEQCDHLLEHLAALPTVVQETYIVHRLRTILVQLRRRGSTHTLDDELRYQSDQDYNRAGESYGLVRIVLWAIPILGFLGTVIGITMAIAQFSPKEFEQSITAMTQALNVAFDTTALALTVNIPLMFGMFYLRQYENQLLEAVDGQVAGELAGRFAQTGTATDPNVSAVRLLGEKVLHAVERMAQRQVELWQSTLGDAQSQWSRLTTSTASHTQEVLVASMGESLKLFAGHLAAAERAATEQTRKHWDGVQQSLTRCTDAVLAQQQELTKQGEVLVKVVDATGQVQKLEDELNRNLAALAGAKHFEETVMSLAAAIQLLSARLGGVANVDQPAVQLGAGRAKSKVEGKAA